MIQEQTVAMVAHFRFEIEGAARVTKLAPSQKQAALAGQIPGSGLCLTYVLLFDERMIEALIEIWS